MCLMVFLASARSPPSVPWNGQIPSFHTAELSVEDEPVRVHFPGLQVTYLGSHEGCGCGFNGLDPDLDHEPEELVASTESVARLRDYLGEVLKTHLRVWIYSAWSDELGEPTLSSRIVGLAEFSPGEFYFRNRELLELRRS